MGFSATVDDPVVYDRERGFEDGDDGTVDVVGERREQISLGVFVEIAGLTEAPSTVVKPPRVKESPIHLECKLHQIVAVGDGGVGSASIVIGEVVHIHIAEEVLQPNYHIDTRALDPVGRLAGPNYGTIGEIIQIARQAPQIKTKD